MIRLSLYIITFNEEERLARTLEAAKDLADEIVIVDSGSTDRTEEIARNFGARFYFNEWISFGDQVRVAEEYCEGDWVLRLDADEEITPELAREIAEIKKNPDCDGYRLRIGDVYPGVFRPIRWVKHYRQIRLYDRRKMKMMGVLDHDAVDYLVPHPRVRTLRNFICHHSFLSISHYLKKMDRSTDTQIRMLDQAGKNYPSWRMIGTSSLTFFRCYVINRHFLYGYWGFWNSVLVGFGRFTKFAKCYEAKQNTRFSYEGRQAKGE